MIGKIDSNDGRWEVLAFFEGLRSLYSTSAVLIDSCSACSDGARQYRTSVIFAVGIVSDNVYERFHDFIAQEMDGTAQVSSSIVAGQHQRVTT